MVVSDRVGNPEERFSHNAAQSDLNVFFVLICVFVFCNGNIHLWR